MLSYVHPLVAALVLALLGYVASLAIRSRNDRRAAPALLRQHARLAHWTYALVLATWAGGLLTMWWFRPERALAASGHFRGGVAMVVLLSASAFSSRWMESPAVRSLHPWFGATALLVAAAQVFLGLQIMR
ncbi:MAG: DUF4079 family protein [Deltaproteobacteria bacterium]|nr:DUF4079 family protein [Deltaproteobacteria bacterium]